LCIQILEQNFSGVDAISNPLRLHILPSSPAFSFLGCLVGALTTGLPIMTWVIDSSSYITGAEPPPEEAGQPMRPPKDRTRNSNIDLDVSRESQKVYGVNMLVDDSFGKEESDKSVGSEDGTSRSDFEACGTNSSSASSAKESVRSKSTSS